MNTLEQACEWLRQADAVVALTGAGISAESGIPTFRGAGGLWKQYRPEELATPEAFARDPRLVWEWYDWRRGLIAQASPNQGHYALVDLERRCRRFTLVTQNVDGLHDRAGSRNILKLHGDIWTLRCTACGKESRNERPSLPELPPRCSCGGLLRPGVVWFGEALPEKVWSDAQAAARQAEVLLVVGTSAVVYPAIGLVPIARSAGARVIEVNLEETPLSEELDCSLRGRAGEILPKLV
ncbi:MAG: SIR2 family NAD-dependent protein deacylase [Bryobacteraceae bacterium]